MATVYDSSRQSSDEAQSPPTVRLRFDPPHGELPILARIPDISELLAAAASEHDDTSPDCQQSDDALAVVAESATLASEVVAESIAIPVPIPQDRHDAEPRTAAAGSTVIPPPRFAQHRRERDRSLVQRALAVPSRVPDGVFWSTVCGVLLLVAVIVWFNRDTHEAQLPDGWENGQALTDSDLQPPEVIAPPTYTDPTNNAPNVEQHAPSVAEQRNAAEAAGPTLADPNVSSYDEATADEASPQQPPDDSRPGMARLQGIIEKPDMRATNDRTESRVY